MKDKKRKFAPQKPEPELPPWDELWNDLRAVELAQSTHSCPSRFARVDKRLQLKPVLVDRCPLGVFIRKLDAEGRPIGQCYFISDSQIREYQFGERPVPLSLTEAPTTDAPDDAEDDAEVLDDDGRKPRARTTVRKRPEEMKERDDLDEEFITNEADLERRIAQAEQEEKEHRRLVGQEEEEVVLAATNDDE
jgi:hypothetical protein